VRLTFITSSLAPGKDGVGDYTRELASSCQSLGARCALVALNDHRIERTCEETQSARGESLLCLRLPASDPWPERQRIAEGWLSDNSTDLISLQFVAYGYHPKGIVRGLDRLLAAVIGDRPLHLMLHELWIGAERGAPLRRRLIGTVQRRYVLAMIQALAPRLIHTSNAAYASLLRARRVEAGLLPLCGSIPIIPNPDPHWLGRELTRLGVAPERAMSRDRCWRFGIFGTMLSFWSPEPLFSYIAEAARCSGREVIVAAIGRTGPGATLWQSLQHQYGGRFSFAALGERSAEEISRFLQSIDFGIAMTPWQLIGKSGTTAAMLDHGLPVVVSRDDVHFDVASGPAHTPPLSPLLHRVDQNCPRWLLAAKREPPCDHWPETARRFLAEIEASAHPRATPRLTGLRASAV
jgi:hypothetical protein